jgi:predicted nuclease with TOPRIM domain
MVDHKQLLKQLDHQAATISTYQERFARLQKVVDQLEATIKERQQTIADLINKGRRLAEEAHIPRVYKVVETGPRGIRNRLMIKDVRRTAAGLEVWVTR